MWLPNRLAPKGEFGKNVLVVFSGAALGQIATLATAPLLSRLYSASDFGVCAVFLALVQILGSIASAKYEMAINIPAQESEAQELLRLGIYTSVATSALLSIIAIATILLGIKFAALEELGNWLLAVPVGVFLTGTSLTVGAYCNRKKLFALQARIGVIKVLSTNTLSVLLAIIGMSWKGLILGSILGQILGTLFLVWQLRKEGVGLTNLNWQALKTVSGRYARFPRYLIPSGFIETGCIQLPVLLFGHFYGMQTVGHFSFATRLINLPLALLGKSFGDVFKQSASERINSEGNCSLLFRSTARRLGIISIPLGVGLMLSPALFSFVFGDQWREAGVFAQILAGMFVVRFISNPLSVLFYLREQQHLDLVIQCVVMICLSLVLTLIGSNHITVRWAVAAYAVIYAVKYLYEYHISEKLSKNINV